MLGLGSTLNTGSAHEQKYSLILDGTGDYIHVGNQNLITNGDFSISVWAKHTGSDYIGSWWIGKFQNADNRWYFANNGDDPPKAYFASLTGGTNRVLATGGTSLDGADFTNGSWHNFVVSVDRDGNEVHYIDGVQDSSASCGDTTDLSNTGPLIIGAYNDSGSNSFEGNMDEVAFFNVALDADAVAAIYNSGKPFDLNQNRGNYDNSSALTGYWRMGNGPFDDKANGIVHDAHNPGFGAGLATGNDSTFDGANNWIVWVGGSISTSGGVLELTLSGGGNTVDSGATLDISSSLTVGKTYRISADMWLGTAGMTAGYRVSMAGVEQQITLSTTPTTFVSYHTALNDNTLVIYQTDVDSDTGTWYIDNVSVNELNGFPAIANADATFSTVTPDD